jgi:hypothetical protein
MNEDQKAGALILVVVITFIAVTLVLSQGWSHPEASLYLKYQYGDSFMDVLIIPTRYVLAPLVIVAGYGAIRYFSLIPPLFRRQTKTKNHEP